MSWKQVLVVFLIFIFAETFIIYKSAHAGVTVSQVKQVYKRLCIKLDNPCPALYIYGPDDTGSGAYADQDGVHVSTEFMGLLRNTDELAHVLAHELGHIVKGDTRKALGSFTQEYNADQFGANLMVKAGFNRCRGIRWFLELSRIYGDDTSITHPMNSLRYARLNYDCPK